MIPTFEQVGIMINTGMQIAEALGGDGSGTPGSITIPEALEDIAFALKQMQEVQIVTEKDVNFIDYDGTLEASYTAEEFAALTELPPNPKHRGLISQGWNWTLEDAQEYVAAHGKLNIGQCYSTSNGTTRLHIDIYHRLVKKFKLAFAVNGTVEIDWGDGSEKTTLTGTSAGLNQQVKTDAHEYASTGKYTIELDVKSGSAALYAPMNSQSLFVDPASTANTANRMYCNVLYGLEIGNNMTVKSTALLDRLKTVVIPPVPGCLGNGAFSNRKEIKAIIIPSGFTEIADNDFSYMPSLEYVSLPKSIVTIGNDAFRSSPLRTFTMPPNVSTFGTGVFQACEELEEIYLPPSLTAISNFLFYMAGNIETIEIPAGVTSIGESAFQYCAGLVELTIPSQVETLGTSSLTSLSSLRELHFKSATPPTTGSDVFGYLPTFCKIYVPTGSLSAYTSAQGFPNSSAYTYVEE